MKCFFPADTGDILIITSLWKIYFAIQMTWKTLIFLLMMSVSLIISSNFRECLLLWLRLKYEIEAVVGFSENFTPIFYISLP